MLGHPGGVAGLPCERKLVQLNINQIHMAAFTCFLELSFTYIYM